MALRVVATRPDGMTAKEPPPPVERSGVVLNHAILLAEVLGVDAAAARATIDAVHAMLEPLPQIFSLEDQEVMIGFLERLLDALGRAIDAEGRPTGQALAESERLRTEDGGALVVISSSFRLADLHQALGDALANFNYAHAHGLLVRVD